MSVSIVPVFAGKGQYVYKIIRFVNGEKKETRRTGNHILQHLAWREALIIQKEMMEQE